MSAAAIRVLIIAILVGVVIAAVVIMDFRRQNAKADRATVEQSTRTDVAAGGIANDAGAVKEVLYKTEVVVRDSRESYMRGYEDARSDQVVADWADTPVPQRLRDLARERREERQRPGYPGDGSGGDPGKP